MKQHLFSWQLNATIFSTLFFSSTTIWLFQHNTFFVTHYAETYQRQVDYVKVPFDIHQFAPTIAPAMTSPASLAFVGDIMLARSVESWMRDSGASYPFRYVPDILGSTTATFANFEAAIPIEHERTAAYSTRFGADPQYISELARSGITHVSLANNHAYDFGLKAERNAMKVLIVNQITPFGDANTVSSSSLTYSTLGSTTVSILGIQTVYGQIDRATLAEFIGTMKETSDLQIVFVHWGTEYQLHHSAEQEVLATYLVSQGIDVIIGHHPHVVEDIALIHGVPVFYSLGNFIFDQYFSTDVQQGLALKMVVDGTTLTFTLLPVTSIDTHAQPQLMKGNERIVFLQKLAMRSEEGLESSIRSAEIKIPYSLQNVQH